MLVQARSQLTELKLKHDSQGKVVGQLQERLAAQEQEARTPKPPSRLSFATTTPRPSMAVSGRGSSASPDEPLLQTILLADDEPMIPGNTISAVPMARGEEHACTHGALSEARSALSEAKEEISFLKHELQELQNAIKRSESAIPLTFLKNILVPRPP